METLKKIPFRLLAVLFSMAFLLGLVMPILTLGSGEDAEQLGWVDAAGTACGMVFGTQEGSDYGEFAAILRDSAAQAGERAGAAGSLTAVGAVALILAPLFSIAGAALFLTRKKKLLPVVFHLLPVVLLTLANTLFGQAAGLAGLGYSPDVGFWVAVVCEILALACIILHTPAPMPIEEGRSASALNVRRLTETAVLIALGTILSELKFITIPFGGGITLFAMVPMILLAYRWGLKWGFFSSFVFGVFQMLLGIAKHSFGFDLWIVILDILLEYIVAYTLLGFGGLFRNRIKNASVSLAAGSVLAVFARYFVHFVAGFWFWGSYAEWFFTDGAGVGIGNVILGSFEGAGLAAVYSGILNGSLMLGEMVLTVVAALIIGRIPALAKKMA